MKRQLLFLFFILLSNFVFSQGWWMQYFDGADTLPNSSVQIIPDTGSGNIWQIGKPQKTLFNKASTVPNVLITDTVNNYPVNNTSSFMIKFIDPWNYGVLALHWNQKLDMDSLHDGGIIEFSLDSGTTWENAFTSPYVYNFYGFNSANHDTLVTGENAFSGTDTTWRNIWFCFGNSFLFQHDTVFFRFTFKSDSIHNNREGWMIDNMIMSVTQIHTVKGPGEQSEYLKVFPNVTDGIVHIEAQKLQQFHIIENMELRNAEGKLVERYGTSPTKFFIDLRSHQNGMYYLSVNTNIKSEVFQIILNK